MKNTRYFGWLFLMTTCITNVLSQQLASVGTIINGTVHVRNNALVNASVLLQLSKDSTLVKGCITDSTGNFIFRNIQPGDYFITVEFIGYENYVTSIFPIKNLMEQYAVPHIMLHDITTHSLGEVTISAKRQVIERKVGMMVFNVENSISAAGSTAWDILKQAPSVKTDEQGNVSLRANNRAGIMINSKLVSLSGDDLMNLLNNMRAEDISRIEVITNPSARYDAEGSGGLINIITKRNKAEGWNGAVTSGYEQTTYARYNTGLNLHFKHKNLTISGNYGYKNGNYLTREYLEQWFDQGNVSTIYNETLERHRKQVNDLYKLDVSYAVSKKSTVGILIDGNHTNRNNNDESNTPISTMNGKMDSVFLSKININGNNNYFALNTNYRGLFDTLGNSLNVDIDYLQYSSNNSSFNSNYILGVGTRDIHPPLVFRSRVPQLINIYTAKIDYSHFFNAHNTLDFGAKANITETKNNYTFENLVNDTYINDSTKSNRFNYQEGIIAFYGNFTKTINNVTVEAGLRGEYTRTKGNSLTLNSIINRSYFKVFPTFYLQKKFSNDYQLELNYGKRIVRPSYGYVNSFRYYSTPYSYSEGNPFLQPAFTNSLELVNTFKQRFNITLYYTATKGEFVQIPEQNTETKTIVFHRINLDRTLSYGMYLELPFDVGKWQSYNSIDASYDQVSSDYLGSDFSYKKLTANINSVQSFEVFSKWSVEIRGNYRLPSVSGLFHLGVYSEVGFGVKRKLRKDRITASLNFSDIFRGTIMPASVSYLNQKSIARTDKDVRGVRINLTYRLGKSKLEPVKEHSTGNKEEQTRVIK